MNLKKSTFDRKFGIEFEMEQTLSKEAIAKAIKQVTKHSCEIAPGWAESKSNNYWHVKYDSTCGIEKTPGWEVATPVGSSILDLKHFAKVGKYISSAGCVTNKWCGLHTHVNTSDMTTSDVGTLVATWIKLEPLMFQMFPLHRRKNYYCRPLRKAKSILKLSEIKNGEDFYQEIKPTKLYPHENPDKKYSLNLVGYVRSVDPYELDKSRPTIEFRVPECVMNYFHIKYTSLFIINFVEQKRSFPSNLDAINDIDEYLDLVGLGGRNAILDHDLVGLKQWVLKRFIKFGTEKIQKSAKVKLNYITKLFTT